MRDLKIFNEVKAFRVPRTLLKSVFERFVKLEKIGRDFDVNLVFVGSAKMTQINEEWKGGIGATDVLSFNYDDGVGEIYICVKVATKNALESGLSPREEILFLFAHGLLHLAGYTHENEKKLKVMMEKGRKIVW
jgi:probable rRNA maturation factor